MGKQHQWSGAVEKVKRTFTAVGRSQTNLYNIEGIRLHERALRAGLNFETTLLSESFADNNDERPTNLLTNLSTKQQHTIPDKIMHDLNNGRGLGSIISLLTIPAMPPLPEQLANKPNPLILVAVNIVDPGNVGAMIRTGHASGIQAFVVTGVSDPYHPKAVRTSMGSLFKTAVYHYESIDTLLSDLHQLNVQTVGSTLAQSATPLAKTPFTQTGTAVFMGNEYHGLPDSILVQLDQLVNIPMAAGIDSLSVNAATAVILYEIQRQKG